MHKLLPILIALALIAPLLLYARLQAPEAADGKIHLRYMAWGNTQQKEVDRHVLDLFEQSHPNIKVDFLMTPNSQYAQKLLIMLTSGTEPDVFRADMGYFAQYANLGYFAPLDNLIAQDPTFHLSDYLPQAIDEVTINGHVLGLNTLYGGKIIYYNKDLFKKAGLTDPHDLFLQGKWDLDHMLAAAQALTIHHGHDTLQVGLNLGTDDVPWILWSFGGDLITLDNQIKIDQPASIRGLQFYADLRHKYHVIPNPSDASLSVFTFETGKLGMTTGFAGESPRYRRLAKFDWDIVPVPSGPAGRFSLVKGNGLSMSTHTAHPHEAWELIKYMSGPETERTFGSDEQRRALPTLKSVAQSPDFLKATQRPFNTDTFSELYKTAHRYPYSVRSPEWGSAYGRWMDRMMTDDPTRRVTPEAAALGMKEDIQKVLASQPWY